MKFKSLPKAFGTAAVGTLIAATCVVANPSAAAADVGPINYDAPTKATDVSTFKEYVAPSGARLQLRMGKYKGSWYRWGRASNPTSNLNKTYNLGFSRSGASNGCGQFSQSTVDIDGTSYTGALKVTAASSPYCEYTAFWHDRNGSHDKEIVWRGR
ncbi:hypothetical protein FAF44_02050 [Nonomuraea sp. MG754425]|uniref:hypothetical protein n=1 Tax=Nonomuraea sp. MG754425 TaxID=2570319 RepID=UPI001F2A2C16|nr:hypothetical protein [Nonomuraea sp. MG754425]MCF6467197.1 hypothetical protein [Nonomuraea sp. MG754425]